MTVATRTARAPAGSLAWRGRASRFKLGPQDAAYAREAGRIQDEHRGWVVMWSTWRRMFTAFSCFTPDRLVLDKTTSSELLTAMWQIELRYSAPLPEGSKPISP